MSNDFSVPDLNEPLENFHGIEYAIDAGVFFPKTTLIIHDNDPDGWCAAQILRQIYVQNMAGARVELFPIGHGLTFQNYNVETLPKADIVFILDHMVMEELAQRYMLHYEQVVVIDHHQGTCESHDRVEVLHSLDYSTTGLVFRLFKALGGRGYHHQSSLKLFSIARMVNYCDAWLFDPKDSSSFVREFEKEVKGFIAYLFTFGVQSFDWDSAFSNDYKKSDTIKLSEIVKKGIEILAINQAEADRIYEKRTSFRTMVVDDRPYKVALVFHSSLMDELGSTLMHRHEDEIDFAVIVSGTRSGEFFSLSLRSDNDHVDVGQIAKTLGGGGHRNAAGCRMSLEDFVQAFSKTI